MIPLSLTARNYRSYAELNITFDLGVTALAGENGAGKSTIVDAIDTALFADGARELKPLLRHGATEMTLSLEFEHGNGRYIVKRDLSGRGRIGCGFFQVEADGPNASPLNRETATATQAELERILGFDRDTFRASAFCRQRETAVFCDAQPRDRKALLGRLLRLELWEGLLEQARADQRTHGQEMAVLENRAQAAEEIIAEREARVSLFAAADVKAQAATAEREHATHRLNEFRQAYAEARHVAEQRRALEAERARHDSEMTRVETMMETAERAQQEKTTLLAVLAPLELQEQAIPGLQEKLTEGRDAQRAAEIALAEHARLTREADQAQTQAATQRRRADELEARPDSHERCDRCQQVLGREARASAVASLRAEADQAEAEAAKAFSDAAALEIPAAPPETEIIRLGEQLNLNHEAARQAATARERLRIAEEWITTCAEDQKLRDDRYRALEAWRSVNEQLSALVVPELPEGNEDTLAARVDYLRRIEHEAIGALELARDRLNAVDIADAQLVEIQEQLTRARDYQRVLELAEQAFGRNGVPAYIVENRAVPQLEAQANDILERWAAPYRVELRTQRELKSGGMAEALDIIGLVGSYEQPFESFSGGEQTRIAVALRIGLARLLGQRRGSRPGLLVIDEPDGLDAEGMGRLPGLLESLASEYAVIVVVSHNPLLATAFPRVLRVSKAGGVSRVDAVAA